MISLPDRALTIRQPWAHFIVNLPPRYRKPVENRSQNMGFFESFWIHSSKEVSPDQYEDACETALSLGIPQRLIPAYDALDCGKIIGRVTCTALLAPGGIYHHGTKPRTAPDQATSDWYTDHWGYILENPIAGPVVKCSGSQNFWRVPPDILAKLSPTHDRASLRPAARTRA